MIINNLNNVPLVLMNNSVNNTEDYRHYMTLYGRAPVSNCNKLYVFI